MIVAAVVVHWNNAEATRKCVISLLQARGAIRIVLVDNGSSDGSCAQLASEMKQIELLTLPTNTGFCGGSNAGANRAIENGAEAVFFLNNDAQVDPHFLSPLVTELEREPTVGAVGSLVLFDGEPGVVWCLGGNLRFRENVSELGFFRRPRSEMPSVSIECDYLPGCAMLVRSALFRGLRGFDESFFAYMEDVDFGLRAKAQGARCKAVPASVVFHAPSSSTGGGYSRARKYANALNSVRFLRRHGGVGRWTAFILFDIISLPFVWLREALAAHGDPGAASAKCSGIWDGICGRQVTAERLSSFAAAAKATP